MSIRIRKLGRLLTLLALLALFGLSSSLSTAAAASDIKDHWAESVLSEWVKTKRIQGYTDGTIRPDSPITRGEAMALANRSFGFSEQADIQFKDLSSNNWAFAEVAKAVQVGYIVGFKDNTIRTGAVITRQEMAVILTRLLKLNTEALSSSDNGYADAAQFASWSRKAIAATAEAKIMKGYSDSTFRPEAPITRAETVVTLERALAYMHANHEYEQPGIYGPAAGIEHIAGDVIVRTAGVTLQNMEIEGDLLLEEGILEGDVYLKGVIVRGTTTIKGGGADSIHFENSELAIVIVEKALGKVRVVLHNGTIIQQFFIRTQAYLELEDEKSRVVSLIMHAVTSMKGKGVIEYALAHSEARGSVFERMPLRYEGDGFGQTPAGIPQSPNPVPNLKIVENGQSRAVILIGNDAAETVQAAASTLAEYVFKSTGAQLQVESILDDGSEPELAGHPLKIYVGTSGMDSPSGLQANLASLKTDGFVIVPGGNSVTIVGPTDMGTRFGVYEFLERYVGVRWLMPGDIGEDVPQLQSLSIPQSKIVQDPVFLSRDVVGFIGYHMDNRNEEVHQTQMEWLDHNRNNSLVNYHHNLYKLFPPEQYKDTHPEFFPQVDGVPYIPATVQGWQPCFTADGIVEEAVKNIKQYFRENPDKISYSLGVNDGYAGSAGYCEKATSKNSIGVDNMSDIYYSWVNQVVAGVTEQFPDKLFGLLAYGNVFDPPSFPLHPNVIPIITEERYVWSQPELEQAGKQVMQNWLQSAEQIAWYDYIWGSPYIVPRVFNTQLADNLRYAAEHGVTGYFGEAYPNFAEGPKWWVLMKLLWNPQLDEEALMQEWYTRAVGEAAAADLAQYYAHWEKFWQERAYNSLWYKNWYNSTPRYSYLPFNDPSYALEITVEEMQQSRALLEAVVEKASAGTPQQLARAQKLLHGFELYEASVLSYPTTKMVKVPDNTTEAIALLDELLARESLNPEQLADKRIQLIQEFETDPILVQVIRAPIEHQVTWSGKENMAFLVQWIAKEPVNSPLRQHLQGIVDTSPQSKEAEVARYLLGFQSDSFQLLTENGSLEEVDSSNPTDIKTKGWYYSYANANRNPTEEYALRTDEVAHTGGYSVAASGITTGVLFTSLELQEPLEYIDAKVYYYSDADAPPGGALVLALVMYDKDWKHVGTLNSDTRNISETAGGWSELNLYDSISSSLRNRVKYIQVQAYHYNIPVGSTLYFEDISLYATVAPEVAMLHASADNGEIRARFAGAITAAPTPEDFSVMQKINGGQSEAIEVESVAWDAASKTATLQVQPVAATGAEQTVQYLIAYKSMEALATAVITVIDIPNNLDNLVLNHSFESGDESDLSVINAPWYRNLTAPSTQKMERTTEVKRTGAHGLHTSGLTDMSSMNQYIAIEPGDYLAEVYYYVPEQSATVGKILWYNAIFDEIGAQWIGTAADSAHSETQLVKGQWVKYSYRFTVDESYSGVPAGMLRLSIAHVGFKEGESIYYDDFALYKLK